MNKTEEIREVQNLLYIWMSKFYKRSLAAIKANCDYLNEIYSLDLPNPIWGIFWPLVFNGLIDHIGKGYYALVEPLIIDYKHHFVYINYIPNHTEAKQLYIGMGLSCKLENLNNYKVIKADSLAILKRFPSIDNVVDTFNDSSIEESALSYYNYNVRKGIAKLELEGLTRYFSIPEEMYMKELPDRTINPEAFSIAYCYSRVINNEVNGVYHPKDKTLLMPTFAMPFMLYRALILHTLSMGQLPVIQNQHYVFQNVPDTFVKQLNRILLKSIRYE